MSGSSWDLPAPGPNQAYCDVSALEGGVVQIPCPIIISPSSPGETIEAPALGFLVQHTKNGKRIVFDLGIRKDVENSVPITVERAAKVFKPHVPQDVADSLAKGGIKAEDVTDICLSHCHWDHVGNPALFPNATFYVGGDSLELFKPGYPEDLKSSFASDLLPKGRTKYLDAADWTPIGPFPRALDFYGDGSLYVVDAPGHVQGHINFLVRTSPDGDWLYLAGDSAHDWRLIRRERSIAVLEHSHGAHDEYHGIICMHRDKVKAEEHMQRVAELVKNPRARAILAHDGDWYRENRGGSAFFPGKIANKGAHVR